MNKILLLFCIFTTLLFVACTNKNIDNIHESENHFTNINHHVSVNQENSNKVKQTLKQYDYVTDISVVNNNKDIVAYVNVTPFKRFKLKKIEKQLEKKLKKQFPHKKITLSTDKKIMIELQKIEKSIQKEHISEDQINNKISHIKKLSKEQT